MGCRSGRARVCAGYRLPPLDGHLRVGPSFATSRLEKAAADPVYPRHASRARAQTKLADIPRAQTIISPARKPEAEEAALYSRALFTLPELEALKKRFTRLDFVRPSAHDCTFGGLSIADALTSCSPLQDQDDMITTADLKHALSRLGYSAVDEDTIGQILQEVDFDRKGSINFEDFIEIAAGLKGPSASVSGWVRLRSTWLTPPSASRFAPTQSSRSTRPSRTSLCRTTPRRTTSPPRSRPSAPAAASKAWQPSASLIPFLPTF